MGNTMVGAMIFTMLFPIIEALGFFALRLFLRFLDRGCFLSMTDFVTSKSLTDVAVKMTFQEKEEDISLVMKEMEKTNMFKSVSLDECHKQVVLEMIARSFASKGDLTTLANVGYNTLLDQLDGLWEALLKANLSIVVLDAAGETLLLPSNNVCHQVCQLQPV